MSRIESIEIRKLKRISQRPGAVWQGGFVRFPGIIRNEDGEPERPFLFIAADPGHMTVGSSQVRNCETRDPELAVEAIAFMATRSAIAGYRPGAIEVNDESVVDELSRVLGQAGIKVIYSEDIPEFETLRDDFLEKFGGAEDIKGMLSVSGVTVEHVRAYAEAAVDFYHSAPWRHLSNDDIICVETPVPEPDLGYFAVLGSGSLIRGLGFYRSPDQMWVMQDPELFDDEKRSPLWLFDFVRSAELTDQDFDLWNQHDLPCVDGKFYPWIGKLGGRRGVVRPDAGTIQFIEAVLRAISSTTEEEMDSGRWTKRVTTSSGWTEVTLSLPCLVDESFSENARLHRAGLPDRRPTERILVEMERFIEQNKDLSQEEIQTEIENRFLGKKYDELPSTSVTPVEQAQDLAYEAAGAIGRKKIILARRALEISPDCADALVLLAECAYEDEKALEFYSRAVDAAGRVLGSACFEENAGHFWGMASTRPYMRARLGLAETLVRMDRLDEGIEHYRELLRLNPDDNQGVRYRLMFSLLQRDNFKGISELSREYPYETCAEWLYPLALAAYREKGDTEKSRKLLDRALSENRFVSVFLLDPEKMPPHAPEAFRLGSEEEAVHTAALLRQFWYGTEGAVTWLKVQSRKFSRKKSRRPRSQPKKRKKRR